MDHDARRRILRALPAALHALAVADDAPGGAHATLVSWAMPVSTEPPLVAVALEADGTTLPLVRAAGAFTLAPVPATAEGRALAMRLGRRGREAPAKGAGLATAPAPATGAPRVEAGAGWLECRVAAIHDAGDHALVVGAVVAAGAPPEVPALLTVGETGWRYGW